MASIRCAMAVGAGTDPANLGQWDKFPWMQLPSLSSKQETSLQVQSLFLIKKQALQRFNLNCFFFFQKSQVPDTKPPQIICKTIILLHHLKTHS